MTSLPKEEATIDPLRFMPSSVGGWREMQREKEERGQWEMQREKEERGQWEMKRERESEWDGERREEYSGRDKEGEEERQCETWRVWVYRGVISGWKGGTRGGEDYRSQQLLISIQINMHQYVTK
jgi:hypothetical protein